MIPSQPLGGLNRLHELMTRLVESLPDDQVNRRFDPKLPALGWLLGRAVYQELYWLREVVSGDRDLTDRVRHLFAFDVEPSAALEVQLPPKHHLLNWALEIQDAHLTLLANPGSLPEHPMLAGGWLVGYLTQSHGQLYEQILTGMLARALHNAHDEYRPAAPLIARPPRVRAVEITQGHYRIGGRNGILFDTEQPEQIVELPNIRIAEHPVSNTEFLAFMQDEGYTDSRWWDVEGESWRREHRPQHPWQWRKSAQAEWFAIGLNGPADLPPGEPVYGLSRHEAQAFANWASAQSEELAGAALQHEYQWEVAARFYELRSHGKVGEWCNNPFAPYDQYRAPADAELTTRTFDGAHYTIRGSCLHTQPELRRPSLRQAEPPDRRQALISAFV